ncbi:hypothetical protein LCGC14_2377620 [marine sediment metagenome]|uniref:Uncharacterized protein n=1 Tax=marine sediment metagenome TaxID=412755 RepID=A0A0F9C1Y5_9ZZZZ
MLDKRLNGVGKVTIERGQILCEGFSADDCMCREVAIFAMMWAIDQLWREVQATIDRPGGNGTSVIG